MVKTHLSYIITRDGNLCDFYPCLCDLYDEFANLYDLCHENDHFWDSGHVFGQNSTYYQVYLCIT